MARRMKRSRGFSGTREEHETGAKLARNTRAVFAEKTEQDIREGQCRTALRNLIETARAASRFDVHYMEAHETSTGFRPGSVIADTDELPKLRQKFAKACLRAPVYGETRELGAMRRRKSRR